MKRALGGALVALGVLAAAPAHAEPPRVLASIAPLQSLAAAVMEGIGEPELLVPGAASDHDYALKPSDLGKIAGADLVVWIGAPLETYLAKALATEGARDLELLSVKGVDPHPYGWAREDGQRPGEAEPRNAVALDPHVWLDPVRAEAIASAIAETLAEIDPENGDAYRANATAAISGLEALDAEIAQGLRPHAGKPFVTFHDGYSYFVERYRLNQVGQLAIDPVRRPGAATLRALRARVAADGVSCVFVEPQFDPGIIQALAGEVRIEVSELDAVGAGLEPGPSLYATLMRANAEAIADCLGSTS
jgi:zinc transport system substrate-binding protein